MPSGKITKTTTTTRRNIRFRKKRSYRYRRGKPYNRLPRVRTYAFKRAQESLLALEAPANGWINVDPDGDAYGHCLVKTFTFDMAEVPSAEEFSNLYRQYKLNHVVAKFFPSYSSIGVTTGPVATTNLIITIWANTNGLPLDNTFRNEDLLEIQGKKQFMMPQNKPLYISMPLKQLGNTFAGTDTAGNIETTFAVRKPRYLGTDNLTVPHYGFNVHIRKVDGSNFTSNSPRFLIKESIYLSCRQVH
jgi:hypothetical protein